MKFIKSLFGLTAILTVLGCTSPILTNVSDPGLPPQRNLALAELRNRAYVGGSVIYSQGNPEKNHLYAHLKLPIRLGELSAVTDPESGELEFENLESKALYGTITIESVDLSRVKFGYELFDANDSLAFTGTAVVDDGQGADLDRDGVADVTYTDVVPARSDLSASRYLTFTSSKEALTTSMFSLTNDLLPGNAYPSGIMLVNPDGNFVIAPDAVSVDSGSQSTRNVRSAAGRTVAFQKGDYILDASSGRYGRALQAARSLDGGETAEVDFADDVHIFDALPLVHFDVQQVQSVPQAAAARAASEDSGFQQDFNRIKDLFNQYKSFDLIDKTAWSLGGEKDDFKASFAKLKISAGIKASGDTSWTKISAKVQAGIYYESNLALKASGTWTKNLWNYTFNAFSTSFWIGPVFITLSAPVSMGVDLNINAEALVKYQFENQGFIGYGVDFGAKLYRKHWYSLPSIKTWCDTMPTNENTFRFIGVPEITAKASVDLSPYVSAGIKVELWKIIFAKGVLKLGYGPKIQAAIDNDIFSISYMNTLGVTFTGDFGFDFRIFEKSWEKEILKKNFDFNKKVLYQIPLVNWNKTVVDKGTPVPYPNKLTQSYTFSVPGAQRLKLHFDKFHTEKDRDVAYFYDKAGDLIGKLSGSASYSPIVAGDTIVMKFVSDASNDPYDTTPFQVHVDQILTR